MEKYKTIRRLGAGAFGQVQLVERGGQLYAMKCYAPVDAHLPDHLLREIAVLRYLEHPNLVKLVETLVLPSGVAAVIEYGGETLQAWTRAHNWSERVGQIRSIARQLVGALAFLHASGFAHRDLKPANILYQAGVVRLCDFGSARETSAHDLTPRVATLEYQAPEVTAGSGYRGESTDVWALGCVLFYLLFGQAPFDGRTETVLLRNILSTCPTTTETLATLGLNHISLSHCNTTQFHRLPIFYEGAFADQQRIAELDALRHLVCRMLTLTPDARPSMAELAADPYFSCQIVPVAPRLNPVVRDWTPEEQSVLRRLWSKVRRYHGSSYSLGLALSLYQRSGATPEHLMLCYNIAARFHEQRPLSFPGGSAAEETNLLRAVDFALISVPIPVPSFL